MLVCDSQGLQLLVEMINSTHDMAVRTACLALRNLCNNSANKIAVGVYVCICVYVYVCVCMYVSVCMCVCTYVCAFMCVYAVSVCGPTNFYCSE